MNKLMKLYTCVCAGVPYNSAIDDFRFTHKYWLIPKASLTILGESRKTICPKATACNN